MGSVTTPLLDVSLDATLTGTKLRKSSEISKSSSSLGTLLSPPTITTTATSTRNSKPKRKFSFPISLHSTSTLLSDPNTLSARSIRRLSNVSDAVSRKLSTIGWKNVIPAQDIITQGKCLCSQYVRCRLKRAGLFNKKLGLQRLRSIVGTPSIHVVKEVFPALLVAGEEIERMHSRLYTNVARQISKVPGTDPQTPENASILLGAVARTLLKNQVNWGKVVSIFAICGGLSVDLVRQGHQEYLPKLIDGFGDVIEDELVSFVSESGGWTGLANKMRLQDDTYNVLELVIIFLVFILLGSLCYMFSSYFIYPKIMRSK